MAPVDDHEPAAPTTDQSPSRVTRTWTVALVVVSVVAVGVVIGGLLWPQAEPDLTTAPPTSSAQSSSAAPAENKVVDEPFDPKAPIPGCDKVETPSEPTYNSRITSGEQSYDNPRFPWFNGPKARAMSEALVDLLPVGAEVEFASPLQSLIFQPITDFGDADPTGSTNAFGTVINKDAVGGVQVAVQKSARPVPPCVAGQLDERRAFSNGTVVDVHDTWSEVNGARTNTRSAYAYVADGSWIYALANDSVGTTTQENTGKIPLATDDLVRIVIDPRLRVSATVAPGAPSPRRACDLSVGFGTDDAPAVTRDQALRLDRVLASIDLDGAKPEPLQLDRSSSSILCTSLTDSDTGVSVDISITGGKKPPPEERPDPISGAQKTRRALEDGTVVQTMFGNYSSIPVDGRGPATAESSNSVVVTRPGGTQITVSCRVSAPRTAVPLSRLESIALTPGLDL